MVCGQVLRGRQHATTRPEGQIEAQGGYWSLPHCPWGSAAHVKGTWSLSCVTSSPLSSRRGFRAWEWGARRDWNPPTGQRGLAPPMALTPKSGSRGSLGMRRRCQCLLPHLCSPSPPPPTPHAEPAGSPWVALWSWASPAGGATLELAWGWGQ